MEINQTILTGLKPTKSAEVFAHTYIRLPQMEQPGRSNQE